MWSKGRYDYKRLPRERSPSWSPVRDDSGYRRSRGHHFTRQKSEYRNMRDAFRRKSFYSSQYSRDRSPHKRDASFFRESPVGQKESSHRRSGSSLSSRSYSPEGSKTSSFHQSQYTSKEKSIQSSKTSGDTSPSRSSEVSSSKTGSTGPVFIDQTEEPESNTTDGTELCKDSQLSSRSKAIASKTKEIQQAYRQDFETFGMVVKMLVDKEPSLEKSIQFALRQNLQEMGERCVEELKRFITEYDNSTQDSGDRF
ncbi:periphilin-1 isoform X4 [Cricetulus griseus]|uniref:periphilin-1 isoform X4 n=1 Tax=Cricetulus griseus TaxID=10029 RepID=UPI000F74A967|nr:periphilin-1 isoform X4 [Cricetulus griseus]